MSKGKCQDYYESLYEAVSLLNSINNPRTLLRSVVKSIAGIMDAKACSLMLLTPDREVLLHTIAWGLSDWYLRKGPVTISPAISEVLEGKPVAILDAATDDRTMYREQAKQEGIVSMLSIPMKLRGEVVGVVRLYTGSPREFTEEDIRFVETIGNLAAVALERARVYELVHRDYENFREDMVQWRAELGDEGLMGDLVTPPEEPAIMMPPGG